MSSVLITGARAPVTLELCRAFAQQGHQVYLADVHLFPLARFSRFAVQYIRVPPPAQQFNAFVNCLQSVIHTYQIEHLIPTCEETFYVSMAKEHLPCKVWTSSFDLLRQLHHKQIFLSLAMEYFSVPHTISCTDFADWDRAENYVFKPVFSRFGSQVIIGKPLNQCKAPQENAEDWIAQERLFGQEICVYSIWRKGKLGAFSAYFPKYRVGHGSGVYFEPFFQQRIYEAVLKFGQSLHFDGQLSFDLMLCGKEIYAIECNPRATSGVHLLENELADAFFSEENHVLMSPKAKALKSAWVLSQPGALFYRDFWKVSDVIWNPKDLAPVLGQSLSVLELLFLALRYRQKILAVSTRDIEFNG